MRIDNVQVATSAGLAPGELSVLLNCAAEGFVTAPDGSRYDPESSGKGGMTVRF